MNIVSTTSSDLGIGLVAALLLSLAFSSPLQAAVFQGDFNGDGLEDHVVGVPRDDVNHLWDAGAVAVSYGSDDQSKCHADETPTWVMFDQDSYGVHGIPETMNHFGAALAIGDFNGDGYDDLAVSAPQDALMGRERTGAVHVLYGGSLVGLQGRFSPLLHLGNLGAGYLQSEARFGTSLAAGDFNQDGYVDLAVGVPRHDSEGAIRAGAVVTYWGTAAGLDARSARLFRQGDPLIGEVPETDDGFGERLATADFDQDGYDDLAISARFENLDAGGVTQENAGLVSIVYGGATDFDAARTLTLVDAHGPSGSTVEDSDHFGFALEPGDFNGDGYPDLAIATPLEDTLDINEGMVAIIWSSKKGLQSSKRQVWNAASPTLPNLLKTRDAMGGALAAGDFDKDGFDDLAVGVTGRDLVYWGGISHNVGQVTVLSGARHGLVVRSNSLWNRYRAGVLGGPKQGDQFGTALSVADINHDHIPDLLAGFPHENLGSGQSQLLNAGTLQVFYGTHGDGLSTNPVLGKQWRHRPYDATATEPSKASAWDAFGSVMP